MRRRLTILVGAALVMMFLVGLRAVTSRDVAHRNLEIFTEMAYAVGYESFTAHPDLPGGVTMQAPVEGTVIRGHLPFRYGPSAEEAERAGRELANPFTKEDPVALARGAEVYGIYCAVCHDAGGNGRGRVVERGMIPPPSLHAERARQMADGQMFHVLTMGQGNMASYAAQVPVEDRWKAILHVRALQEGQSP